MRSLDEWKKLEESLGMNLVETMAKHGTTDQELVTYTLSVFKLSFFSGALCGMTDAVDCNSLEEFVFKRTQVIKTIEELAGYLEYTKRNNNETIQ